MWILFSVIRLLCFLNSIPSQPQKRFEIFICHTLIICQCAEKKEKEGKIMLALKWTEIVINCEIRLSPPDMVLPTPERKGSLGSVIHCAFFDQFCIQFLSSSFFKSNFSFWSFTSAFPLLKGSEIHDVISAGWIKPKPKFGRVSKSYPRNTGRSAGFGFLLLLRGAVCSRRKQECLQGHD